MFRLCEQFEFSELLDSAVEEEESSHQACLVAAFAVGQYPVLNCHPMTNDVTPIMNIFLK